MAETLYTIHEAAEFVGKSAQTIRRALKSKKLEAKRKKTPQGFNYLIKEDSLKQLYNFDPATRPHSSIRNSEPSLKEAQQTSIVTEYAAKDDLDKLVEENRKDKETFMRFVKVFQDRFTALENQVKLLEEPATTKKWYQFWK